MSVEHLNFQGISLLLWHTDTLSIRASKCVSAFQDQPRMKMLVHIAAGR